MNFSKETEGLVIGLNQNATAISARLRKIYGEMYVIDPDKGQMEMTLNNVEELLKEMGNDARKLKQIIKS